MKQLVTAIFAALCAVPDAHADLKTDYMMKHLGQHQQFQDRAMPLSTTAGTFVQKLNHDDASDTRTFKQRFFYNTSNANGSNAPTIFYICGESECNGREMTSGEMATLARAFHANVIELEHRYYGQSLPFNDLSADTLIYLRSDFALKDLDVFQHWAMQNLGLTGKWIAVGGSYPGALAAWYRTLYPQNVVGALASSAPVRAKADFEEYDRHVATIAGPDCAAKARGVVAQVEASLAGTPAQRLSIRQQFGGADIVDPVDFLYVVADMGAFAVQYGYVNKFCAALNSSDPVAAYARIGTSLLQSAGLTPYADSFQAAESTSSTQNVGFQLRQWMYQSCTEFGYYQIAYHDQMLSTRSTHIDLPYHNAVCKRLFNIDKPVDIEATNARYYQNVLNPKTTHIFFTNGSEDPWINLSITQANGNATNPNIDMMTINGGSHCSDLANESESDVSAAQWKFISLATAWLQ